MRKKKTTDEFVKGSGLREIITPIEEGLKSLAQLKTAFEDCIVCSVESGEPLIDPFQLLTTLKKTRQSAIASVASAESIYEDLREWAVAESNKEIPLFDPRLRAFCEKKALTLDGRHPRYVIAGFLPVRVNEGTREIKIGGLSVPSLLLDAIAPAIDELVKEERAREFNGPQFIELLCEAYERCLLLNGTLLGEPIPVRKVYQELVVLKQADAFRKAPRPVAGLSRVSFPSQRFAFSSEVIYKGVAPFAGSLRARASREEDGPSATSWASAFPSPWELVSVMSSIFG